jgi:hypothetical protein
MHRKHLTVILHRTMHRFFEGDSTVLGEVNGDDDAMESFHKALEF